MQELRFSHVSPDPAHSSVPSRVAATDRTLRTAEVISLDEVRAVFRPRAPERRTTQAEIIENTRATAARKFFLQDESLLRFRDFDAGP
jgi:hypothetical protein